MLQVGLSGVVEDGRACRRPEFPVLISHCSSKSALYNRQHLRTM